MKGSLNSCFSIISLSSLIFCLYANYHCTANYSCPNEYPLLLQNKNECIKTNYEKSDIINKIITTENIIKVLTTEFSTENINKILKTENIHKVLATSLVKLTELISIIDIKKYIIQYEVQNLIDKEFKNETKKEGEEEIKLYNKVVGVVENYFTSENYSTSNLDKGTDEIIEAEKIRFTFTTTDNQKIIYNIL